MEDIERYGDYNETDEEPSGEKSHIGLILKIVIISVCLLVVGLIIFRVILFSYYPKAMKRIYFNDTLTAYYNEHSGDINAETQKLRAPYDDPDFASFIADNLIIINLLVLVAVIHMEQLVNDIGKCRRHFFTHLGAGIFGGYLLAHANQTVNGDPLPVLCEFSLFPDISQNLLRIVD